MGPHFSIFALSFLISCFLPRLIFGKKNKSLRKNGYLPAVLYGHKVQPLHLAVLKSEFLKVFSKAGFSSLIELKIDKTSPKKVLIREIQKDPISLEPIHIDFYQIKMTEKITTEVPLRFIGESKAVKEMDGTLITNKDTIKIECLPDMLVHNIDVDISVLNSFEDNIKVANLKIPEGIKVLDEPEEVVASVAPPRSEEELAELETPVEEKVEEVEEVKEAEEKEAEETEEETEEQKETKQE